MGSRKIFYSSKTMFLVPLIFFGAAFILGFMRDAPTLIIQILNVIGILGIAVLALGFKTIIVTETELGIKQPFKSQVIHISEIKEKNIRYSYRGAVEMITWHLKLDNGKVLTILGDTMAELPRLKEALNWFLREVPKTKA